MKGGDTLERNRNEQTKEITHVPLAVSRDEQMYPCQQSEQSHHAVEGTIRNCSLGMTVPDAPSDVPRCER